MEDSTRVVDGPKLEEEQDVAEAEMWEGSHEKIPKLLQPNYASVIGDFNLNTRIRIYKVLDVFNWRFNPCELVLKVLLHINARDNILALLKIFEMVDSTSLHNTLCLLLRMDYARIEEFLYDTPHSDLLKLLDVVSFINKKEFELLHDFVQQLGVREVIGIVDTCNEPFAKQCRLCKIQRLASLEYRLIQNQLKPDTVRNFGDSLTTITASFKYFYQYRPMASPRVWSQLMVWPMFGKMMSTKNSPFLTMVWCSGRRSRLTQSEYVISVSEM